MQEEECFFTFLWIPAAAVSTLLDKAAILNSQEVNSLQINLLQTVCFGIESSKVSSRISGHWHIKSTGEACGMSSLWLCLRGRFLRRQPAQCHQWHCCIPSALYKYSWARHASAVSIKALGPSHTRPLSTCYHRWAAALKTKVLITGFALFRYNCERTTHRFVNSGVHNGIFQDISKVVIVLILEQKRHSSNLFSTNITSLYLGLPCFKINSRPLHQRSPYKRQIHLWSVVQVRNFCLLQEWIHVD